MFQSFGLIAIGWVVMALEVQCYWGPPVFGHYKVNDLVAVAEPPELFQLKCPSRTLRGGNTLKSE
jgi:hypothetical protein